MKIGQECDIIIHQWDEEFVTGGKNLRKGRTDMDDILSAVENEAAALSDADIQAQLEGLMKQKRLRLSVRRSTTVLLRRRQNGLSTTNSARRILKSLQSVRSTNSVLKPRNATSCIGRNVPRNRKPSSLRRPSAALP